MCFGLFPGRDAVVRMSTHISFSHQPVWDDPLPITAGRGFPSEKHGLVQMQSTMTRTVLIQILLVYGAGWCLLSKHCNIPVDQLSDQTPQNLEL